MVAVGVAVGFAVVVVVGFAVGVAVGFALVVGVVVVVAVGVVVVVAVGVVLVVAMISLLLTIANLTTQHQVSALSYDWPRDMTYTDGTGLHICTGTFVFTFDGGAMTASIGADRCFADSIKRNGFE